VFIHIPRTAGTAFRTILALNEVSTPGQALGNVFKGAGGVDHDLVRQLRHMRGSSVSGARLVRGHFPLAFRDRLDDGRGLRCFTILRNPVDRALSHFFTVQEEHAGSRRPGIEMELGLPPLPADPTFESAISAGYLYDNLQTRMLSNVVRPFGEVTDEMLEQAKRNLDESLVFFGLTERFDESLVVARRRLELACILHGSNPRIDRINSTRPRGDDLPSALVAAAERANRYDLELYRYACERFDAQSDLSEADFQVGLAALRVAKTPGEIGIPRPAPPSFEGTPEVWRQLVRTTAKAERLEWQLAEQRMKSASARSKIERLEDQVDQLERRGSVSTSPATTSDRIDATAGRVGELEAEVVQLRADAERQAARVEGLVERLRAAEDRNRELQRELRSANVPPAGRRAKIERPKSPQPRSKRTTEASARKGARPWPERGAGTRRSEWRRDDG
jgi:uncharacterized coiled-coil protein SlyX